METDLSDTAAGAARAAQLAQTIVEVLAPHEHETQNRAIQAALMLLGHAGIPQHAQGRGQDSGDGNLGLAELFNRGEKLKPAEHAQLCAAFHYSQHGPVAFSLDEIRSIAADAGVVLPDRLDKTFKSAAHSGKKLFQPAGRAAFKPTSAAALAFSDRWGIRPGRSS